MKIQSTIKDLQNLNYQAVMAICNCKNYKNVMKYFDFRKAVESVIFNQNTKSKN
jgi:hypothetical protein